jgi:hypothetical protein
MFEDSGLRWFKPTYDGNYQLMFEDSGLRWFKQQEYEFLIKDGLSQ